MHKTPKYFQWVEAEHRAVEAAKAFFERALHLAPDESGTVPEAGEVAALRAEADTCYQAAMAELADLGERSSDVEVVATNQLISADFVLLATSKTVN